MTRRALLPLASSLSLALFACTDPEPVALAACQAVPGLATDAAGLALLQEALTDQELDLLKTADPTLGLQAVGEAGLKSIRDQTTCAIDSVESAGAGRWAVKLTRTAPAVSGDGAVEAPVETELSWQVVDVDGGRVETGLPKAAAMRKSIGEAIEQEDYQRVASTWGALSRTYPDPVLSVDVAAAEALQERMDYRKKIELTFMEAGDGVVKGEAANTGPTAISAAVLTGTFEGAEAIPQTQIGALAPGATLEFELPIPDGAEGTVKLKTANLEF